MPTNRAPANTTSRLAPAARPRCRNTWCRRGWSRGASAPVPSNPGEIDALRDAAAAGGQDGGQKLWRGLLGLAQWYIVDRANENEEPQPHGTVNGNQRMLAIFTDEARAQSQGRSVAEVEAEAFSFTSIHHYVDPGQIADQILYLASDRARTISGQAISVCGDMQMLA